MAFSSNYYFTWRKDKTDAKNKAADEKRAQILAIRAAAIGFQSNMESYLLFKSQTLIPHLQDVEKLKAANGMGIEGIIKVFSTSDRLFGFFPKQFTDDTKYQEKLEFTTTYNAGFLNTFTKARSYCLAVDYDFEERNSYIRKHMEDSLKNGVNPQQIMVTVNLITSFAESIALHVDCVIWYSLLAQRHLAEYARANNHDCRTIGKVEDKFKRLIPSDDFIPGYIEMIGQVRTSAAQTSSA